MENDLHFRPMILKILLHAISLASAAPETLGLLEGEGPFTADQCGKAAEGYKFIPTVSTGSMTEGSFKQFLDGGCMVELCHYWSGKFKKVDKATAGADIAASYVANVMGCEKVVAADIHAGTDTCDVLNMEFTLYPDSDEFTFYDIPLGLRKSYVDQSCQNSLCSVWETKYGVSEGSLDEGPPKIQQVYVDQCTSDTGSIKSENITNPKLTEIV